ncbi:hypothetical protein BDN70DRAFT_985786 [Pholiota conissans]|uniref:Uncharacterized protein n=1 Tax=Pholiota conissans TaxID=109636 RepID=A0A9P5YK81_9AGAR|nr:hypothetical protein BDN70DRAFT_985786 [Pholiota conissans]
MYDDGVRGARADQRTMDDADGGLRTDGRTRARDGGGRVGGTDVSGSLSPSSLTSFLVLSSIGGGKTPGHGRHAATDERITTVPRHRRWSTMDEQRTMTAASALEVDEDGRTRTDGRGRTGDDGRARASERGRAGEDRWTMTGSQGGKAGTRNRWTSDEKAGRRGDGGGTSNEGSTCMNYRQYEL